MESSNSKDNLIHQQHDVGVAKQIGHYSDAVEVNGNVRWLISSGTPGLAEDRTLPPDIEGQAKLAWEKVIRLLSEADMALNNLVKVTQYLTNAADVPAYFAIRKQYLGETKAASMLLITPQLVWPEILIEIEILAAKPIGGTDI